MMQGAYENPAILVLVLPNPRPGAPAIHSLPYSTEPRGPATDSARRSQLFFRAG